MLTILRIYSKQEKGQRQRWSQVALIFQNGNIEDSGKQSSNADAAPRENFIKILHKSSFRYT